MRRARHLLAIAALSATAAFGLVVWISTTASVPYVCSGQSGTSCRCFRPGDQQAVFTEGPSWTGEGPAEGVRLRAATAVVLGLTASLLAGAARRRTGAGTPDRAAAGAVIAAGLLAVPAALWALPADACSGFRDENLPAEPGLDEALSPDRSLVWRKAGDTHRFRPTANSPIA